MIFGTNDSWSLITFIAIGVQWLAASRRRGIGRVTGSAREPRPDTVRSYVKVG
jgi:hypothetical protein